MGAQAFLEGCVLLAPTVELTHGFGQNRFRNPPL